MSIPDACNKALDLFSISFDELEAGPNQLDFIKPTLALSPSFFMLGIVIGVVMFSANSLAVSKLSSPLVSNFINSIGLVVYRF